MGPIGLLGRLYSNASTAEASPEDGLSAQDQQRISNKLDLGSTQTKIRLLTGNINEYQLTWVVIRPANGIQVNYSDAGFANMDEYSRQALFTKITELENAPAGKRGGAIRVGNGAIVRIQRTNL